MRMYWKNLFFIRMRRNRQRCLILSGITFAAFIVAHHWFNSSKGVPIYIIEEHHEALLYWFHAVENGQLAKSNITLIHIDGHSDLSSPEYVSGIMRGFQPPLKGEEDIMPYVQRNDVFVQAGVMLGLISRVVWVWPSWDKSLLENKQPYEASTVHLGWYLPHDWSSQPKPSVNSDFYQPMGFCQCETPAGASIDDTSLSPSCVYFNHSIEDTEKQEIKISRLSCKILTSFLSETINDKMAVKLLTEDLNEEDKLFEVKDFKTGSKNIIWDVDEDFFGCENPSKQLVEGVDGLLWSDIQLINTKISGLVCIRHLGHEEFGDQLLRELIKKIKNGCEYSKTTHNCETSIEDLVKKTVDRLKQEFLKHPSLFCGSNDSHIRAAWFHLVKIFHRLTAANLQRLLNVGFCLTRAPKSFMFFNDIEPPSLRICHGLNEPNSTLVYLHTLTEIEFKRQLRLFGSLVERFPRPGVVTLCRSVRDGYTPRTMAGGIELGVLSELLARLDSGKVLYDDDLLGGEDGWESRGFLKL